MLLGLGNHVVFGRNRL